MSVIGVNPLSLNNLSDKEITAKIAEKVHKNDSVGLDELLVQLGPEREGLASAWNNGLLQSASCEGHLDVVKRLLRIPAVYQGAAAKDNDALKLAAQYNHPDIVELLLDIPAVMNNAAAGNNEALRFSANYSNASSVEKLLQIPSVCAKAAVNNNEVLLWAATDNHLSIVRQLLELPEVRRQAAIRDNYALRMAAYNGHTAVVVCLLAIPHVWDHADAASNAALRGAYDNNHEAIVTLLLENPQVTFANLRDQIVPRRRAVARGSLGYIASHLESAMMPLSKREDTGVALLEQRYADILAIRGIEGEEGVLTEIKQYLEDKFSDVPEESRLLNNFHAMYRYLFLNPNPWISPIAAGAKRDERGVVVGADIAESDRRLLACFWLAACDNTFPLPEGYNSKSLKEFIVEQIAFIARGHNREQTRLNQSGKKEVYDNGLLDDPTCLRGVKKNMAQILDILLMNFAPAYRTLNASVMVSHYQSHAVAGSAPKSLFSQIEKLEGEELNKLSEALTEFISFYGDIPVEQKRVLDTLVISDEQFSDYLRAAEAYFGADRIHDPADLKPRFGNVVFDNYLALAQHFRDQTLMLFCEVLSEKTEQVIKSRSLPELKREEPGKRKRSPSPVRQEALLSAEQSSEGAKRLRLG